MCFTFKIWKFIYSEIWFGIIQFGKWYRSFVSIYWTEPNNTTPNLIVYTSSNLEIKTQLLSNLKTSNLILYHWGDFWMVHTFFYLVKKLIWSLKKYLSKKLLRILSSLILSRRYSVWYFLKLPNQTEPNWILASVRFRWKQNLQMYIVVVGMWCILKWISVQLYSNFK